MEEELLNGHTNTSLASKTNIELWQERAPHILRILTLSKEMIKVFLHLLTKNTTKRPSKECPPPDKLINTIHTTKQDLPNKDLAFFRTLILQTT
ncbi:uncharacterized protein E5676_scaffold1119G00150 [Cucumis melo var. makuwa]|uniref:Uncharacterized protein n=2 Tax=Cucumis melo TaxID=3656 RepID=A0A5D3CRG7_CUCMM|nr:uncharacterized protein E5676_scaffold1119G00150 [Cucumis melo var. makuwa]